MTATCQWPLFICCRQNPYEISKLPVTEYLFAVDMMMNAIAIRKDLLRETNESVSDTLWSNTQDKNRNTNRWHWLMIHNQIRQLIFIFLGRFCRGLKAQKTIVRSICVCRWKRRDSVPMRLFTKRQGVCVCNRAAMCRTLVCHPTLSIWTNMTWPKSSLVCVLSWFEPSQISCLSRLARSLPGRGSMQVWRWKWSRLLCTDRKHTPRAELLRRLWHSCSVIHSAESQSKVNCCKDPREDTDPCGQDVTAPRFLLEQEEIAIIITTKCIRLYEKYAVRDALHHEGHEYFLVLSIYLFILYLFLEKPGFSSLGNWTASIKVNAWPWEPSAVWQSHFNLTLKNKSTAILSGIGTVGQLEDTKKSLQLQQLV